MKIYRNNVCVTMNLDEFHDILESDMFDELLVMIMELDENSDNAVETVFGDDYEFSNHQVYHVDDMDSFMELLQDALDDENVRYFTEQGTGLEESMYWSISEEAEETFAKPKKNKKVNKEDAKVKQMLDRYKGIS